MVSYDDKQRADEVKLAAATMFPEGSPMTTVWLNGRALPMQDAIARYHLGLLASVMPLASIGTCEQDGTDLRFVGGSNGLRVCCTGSPQHCWKIG